MRWFGICEERGSGIDKVVMQVELLQLAAPLFESPPGFKRTVLFAHKPVVGQFKWPLTTSGCSSLPSLFSMLAAVPTVVRVYTRL